jgi:hypothetical protein
MKTFIIFCLLLITTSSFATSCPPPTPEETLARVKVGVSSILQGYVYAENDSRSWLAIKIDVKRYLTSIWQESLIWGENTDKAFTVSIGLGSTMTTEDVVNGVERLTVSAAINGYQEYTEFTFEQKVQN